jgi:hypothetical protein
MIPEPPLRVALDKSEGVFRASVPIHPANDPNTSSILPAWVSEAVFFPALARYTRAYNGSVRGANCERPVLGELFVSALSREFSWSLPASRQLWGNESRVPNTEWRVSKKLCSVLSTWYLVLFYSRKSARSGHFARCFRLREVSDC